MAYTHTAHPRDFHAAPAGNAARKPGFFSRFLHAMIEARHRQAEREIAKYLSHTGGRLTDEVEREIERRFFGSAAHF